MKSARFALVLATLALAFAFAASSAAADESGNFIVRLGRDTVGVERYTRTPTRLEVDQVGRAPRVLRRKFVYELANGSVSRVSMVVTPPGSTTPTQTIDATLASDSTRVQIKSATAPAQNLSLVVPAGSVVVALSAPWSGYEAAIMKLMQGKADSLRTTMYFLGATNTSWLSLRRLGRDSVAIFNERQDQYHARVDGAGRILGVLPVAGTSRVGVERVTALDVGALAEAWATREREGQGIGVLSPRDTVRVADAGGASLWIDYGRPGKRGRAIFGSVVPYGELWRTGANAATQFRTDKALDFGGVVILPGTYSLWTIPSPDGWKLVVNSETGQSGTAHKAEKDIATIEMKVTSLPAPVERFTISVDAMPQGGVLHLDWDTTRASAPFTIKP